MKRYIRIIALLLSLLILCACKPESPETPGTPESDTTVSDENSVFLVQDGVSAWRIVYPLETNTFVLEALEMLQVGVKKTCGVELPSSSEMAAQYSKEKTWIILGGTTHQESKDAISKLAENQFSISVIGDHVVIAAGNEALYPTAVSYFMSIWKTETDTIAFPADFAYTGDGGVIYELVANGTSKYTIVYDNDEPMGKDYAEKIAAVVLKVTGVTLPVKRDSAAVEGNYEILIGKTDREFTLSEKCRYMEFGFVYDSEKNSIQLDGLLDYATNYFCETVSILGKTGKLSMSASLFEKHTVSGYGTIPEYSDEDYDTLIIGDLNSYSVTYMNSGESEYYAYLAKLKNEGFTEYATYEQNGNLYATYTDGYTVLSVNRIDFNGRVTIAAETTDTVTLPNLTSDCGEVVTTPQLTQWNGVCGFLIRLSDGRFIVYDGGMPHGENYNTLYEQLVAQNVLGGKPVIAAWMFSHMHNDHVGTFTSFAVEYSSKIELQNVVLNIPGYNTYTQNGTVEAATMKEYLGMVKETISSTYKNSQVIIPHAGQKMWFADAEVLVLYTTEDIAPLYAMTNTNDSSVVYQISIGGQKLMFLGDLGDTGSDILYMMYGDTLKSDFVQIAHHAYNGGDEQMYAAIDADFALWTNNVKQILEEYLYYPNAQQPNHFDVNSVKENLVFDTSYQTVMTISLPYTEGSSGGFAYVFPNQS